MKQLVIRFCIILVVVGFAVGCSTTESNRAITPQEIRPSVTKASAHAVRIVIGDFVNRSPYMSGVFSDGDRLGRQGLQILTTHLSASKDFNVVDRRNLEALGREAGYTGTKLNPIGARYLITGAVTEFGRNETGTRALGGLFGKSKTQKLYAKVALSIVDARSTEILKTYQGAGEYALSNQEILGFGSTAGYDSTLADKVLNLAIMEAVRNLTDGHRSSEW